jgi:dihydroorotase
MTTAIVNGHVIDPGSGVSARRDVLIKGGTIVQIGKSLRGSSHNVDAAGCIVAPGFVDLHVHFREPGNESKETIATGSRAAAHGGFTSVVTMPNTNPPIDDAGTLELVIRRAKETACIKVWPSACATKERAGKEMTEMAELKAVGAVAVTDDGSDISSSWVMRRVLEYADMCGLTFLAHCEDSSIVSDGVMNEGFNSTCLGMPGMPRAMEEIMVERNIRLAAMAGARIHIQHVTTADSVDIIRRAKARGIRVTCETAPHYFTLTDDAVRSFDTNTKMNPPLREQSDIDAIKQGLADGTIDCIATDHAPHAFTEKDVEFQLAPFGIVGLETALALVIGELVRPGVIKIERAVELLTSAPANILSIPAGSLHEGGPADLCIFDPAAEWVVNPDEFASKSRNTPFAGRKVFGAVRATICGGKMVYKCKDLG